MPYIPGSPANSKFASALQAYSAALSADQLANGYSDGRPLPPPYDPENMERSFFAYASWYSELGENLNVYKASGKLPPVPLALA